MTAFEKVLLVLQAQARFDVAEAGAQAAKASAETELAEVADQQAAVNRHAVSDELRRQLASRSLNPALLSRLRGSHRQAAARSIEARAEAERCRESEEQLRTELASQRHRERSLGRTLDAESRRRIAGAEERQAVEQGDAWLRSHWRHPR